MSEHCHVLCCSCLPVLVLIHPADLLSEVDTYGVPLAGVHYPD